jgi:hypothetical protein
MSGGKDGKQKGATDKEIRAHILRKLKEALPKIREANQERKKESAGGGGARECAARALRIGSQGGGADGRGIERGPHFALLTSTYPSWVRKNNSPEAE